MPNWQSSASYIPCAPRQIRRRQLDGTVSSIRALPEIVDAVGDKIEVLMDGGIQSGQDVLRALAYGAKGTMIGKAFAWGLGAAGEPG